MIELYVRNRHQTRSVNVRLLKSIAHYLVLKLCQSECHLGILLVGAKEMTRLNEAYLRHAGSTDVIAFGYANDQHSCLHGEVFICLDEAVRQARRFRTTWPKELVRYLAHGLLHFQGYRDGTAQERRKMKRVENAHVKELEKEFRLRELARPALGRAST